MRTCRVLQHDWSKTLFEHSSLAVPEFRLVGKDISRSVAVPVGGQVRQREGVWACLRVSSLENQLKSVQYLATPKGAVEQLGAGADFTQVFSGGPLHITTLGDDGFALERGSCLNRCSGGRRSGNRGRCNGRTFSSQ